MKLTHYKLIKRFIFKKKIYEIDDARIYTDLVENVAIIKDNKLIKKFHFNKLMVNLRC